MADVTKLSELQQDTHNANKGTARGAKMIEASLKEYGSGRSIVVDKHNRIIGGNKTALAAAAVGMEEVIVVESDGSKIVVVKRTDLDLDTDQRAKELAIADNRASEVSLSWDVDAIKAMEIDPGKFWSPDELEKMFGIKSDLLTDSDDVPDAPTVPTSKAGDLFALGDHRLLCGDSCKLADVLRLMQGDLADCMWTDPPYNLAYQTELSHDEAVARHRRKDGLEVMNDSMTDVEFNAFLLATLGNACEVSKPGGAVYVAHAGANGETFRNAFDASGWSLRQCLIWVKNIFVMGRQDYQWKHEPILYGWKPGAAHHWYGDRSQTTVLEFDRPRKSPEHPTMKPVALVEYCLGNSTKIGDIVLDLFGGSGSTLIACEKMKRAARLAELDPVYVDVIITRWEQATGRKAELLEG
jgi:DNA modification methylase